MPAMIKDLGLDKSDLGIIGSILAISYGISKFLSGVMSDRANPRYFMGVGLILTGIFNFFFGFSSTILYLAIFWGLNGWFQAWGAPPCARLLTHWYSQKERGTWWGIWNSSHGIGGALISLLAAFCAEMWGWRYSMYVPGAICIIAGFYVINRLRDTPVSLGLPPIEKFKNDYTQTERHEEKSLSAKGILFKYILKNGYMWILGISYFFVYAIRQGINDWSTLYLVETKGYSVLSAGACVCWFEIGGIFGSLVAGWASDKIFQGRRAPMNVLFCVAVVAALSGFWFFQGALPVVDSILLFTIGFFIFGPQMLIGMSAVELSHKKAAGSATGFAGCWAYMGAASAGYPLSLVAQKYGWEGFFVALGICAVVSILLLVPLWGIRRHPKYSTPTTGLEAEPVAE